MVNNLSMLHFQKKETNLSKVTAQKIKRHVVSRQIFLLGSLMGTSFMAYAQGVLNDDPIDNDHKMAAHTLEEVIVVGTDQSRYLVKDSSALTGLQLDYLELPRVVNVIPEQLIIDQKITDLGEALRNTAGITQGDGFGGTNDDFFIRGFRRNTVYRNGFRRATNLKTNLSNVEFIQVVRGPASITYGQVEPGGLVDIVTKKPFDEQRLAAEIRLDSDNDRFLLADWSQPIGGSAGIRVVASTQEGESFRDFSEISRDTISLSGYYAVTDSTQIDLAYEYRDESRPLDRGSVTILTPEGRKVLNDVIDIPLSRRFGEEFENSESEFHFFEASLKRQLANDWTLRLGAAYEDSTGNDLQARPRSVVILNADAPITNDGFFTGVVTPETVFDDPSDLVFLARRTDGSLERETEVFYLNTTLVGEFNTWGMRHRLAFGADYRDYEASRYFDSTATTNGIAVAQGGNGPLLNLRDPVYGNISGELSIEGQPLIEANSEDYGFSVNDYIEFTDQLGILVGLRYDRFEIGNDIGTLDPEDEISPQAAINYRFSDNASIFLSYSEAFVPNSAVDLESGETAPFAPENSKQLEFGSKAELFDDKVQLSGAIYRIEKSNVLTFVNGNPELLDGQNSQGLEVTFTGQPMAGMNLVAGYAYTDADIEEAPDNGNRPRNVAEHTGNLWASYELQSGSWEGFGFGGGAFYSGDRYGDNSNTYVLGSYTLVDFSLWYTALAPAFTSGGTMRFQLSAKNIFDEEYYSASGGNERIAIGTPRTLLGSVSFDF